MYDWVILIVIYVTIFASSPLIAILHELGHAFAYLIITKPDKIDIFIGSYGNEQNTLKFAVGRLTFYIKRSFPFIKGIGLCRSYKAETNYLKDIVILLAGPLFTVIAATIPAIIIFSVDGDLLVKISCYIFLGLSILSLINNLVPKEIDKSYNVNLDNDGKQMLFALKAKKALPDYIDSLQSLAKKDYGAGTAKLKNVLTQSPATAEEVLRLLIVASLEAKQYDGAALYLNELERKFKLLPDDLVHKGCVQSLTNRHDEAIATYSKVLKQDRNNLLALNNVGYELIEKGAHQVAKRALDKAIKLKPDFDHPYGNLGYSMILQGDLDGGKNLIDKCLALNNKNAHGYKALGIYFLKLKEMNLASVNFKKASELDQDIDLDIYADELKLLMQQGVPNI